MNKSLKEVRDLIAEKRESMKGIADKAKTEKRLFSDAENTQWDALKVEVRALEDQEARLVEIDQNERSLVARMAPVETQTNNGISQGQAKDLRRYNLFRAMDLMASGKPIDGLEGEMRSEAETEAKRRGIELLGFGIPSILTTRGENIVQTRGQSATGTTTATGDQGGILVPTVLSGFVDALYAKSFLGRVGATFVSNLTGNVDIPVLSTKATISALTESEAMGNTEALFGKVSMSPNRLGASVPVTKQLLVQTSYDVMGIIETMLRKQFSLKIESLALTEILAAIVTGNGNLVAMGTNGAVPTWTSQVSLEEIVAANDADVASMRYLANPKLRSKLKRTEKFSSTNGDPIWEKDGTINGYEAVISTLVPSNISKGSGSNLSAEVFGDFSQLVAATFGMLDMLIDPYTSAKAGTINMTCNMFVDQAVTQPLAFAGIKDLITT
jgi:HK97 family phage major capsid protein